MARFYIIEDDAAVGESLSMFLAEHGHETHRYNDAESFFREVVPAAGDTLIVDIGLPGMSGSQLVRWVSRLREEPAIIVITGQAMKAIERELSGLHIKRLIRKPIDALTAETLL